MIRLAKTEDVDQILSLTKSCAQHMIANEIFQWNEHYPNRESFEKDIERNELYVLEENNSIIGCLVCSTKKDEEYKNVKWITGEEKPSVYLHRLAVDPKMQGKGYAQQLMDYAENWAKENDFQSVRLDTFSKNPRNQRFYERRGYQKLEEIYYREQSDYSFYCYELPFEK